MSSESRPALRMRPPIYRFAPVDASSFHETSNRYYVRESGGALAVDLNLLDSGGNVLFTETRTNASDVIPDEVGGNRYAWFTFINVDGGVAVDEFELFRYY